MPLVRIDLMSGRPASEVREISDGVHNALVETMGVPAADRFQVISEHAAGNIVFDPSYLGIQRTEAIIVIQVTLNVGRTLEQKRALYAAIARNLSVRPGVRPEDDLINLVEVVKENWSFGNGIAQYAS